MSKLKYVILGLVGYTAIVFGIGWHCHTYSNIVRFNRSVQGFKINSDFKINPDEKDSSEDSPEQFVIEKGLGLKVNAVNMNEMTGLLESKKQESENEDLEKRNSFVCYVRYDDKTKTFYFLDIRRKKQD